MTYEYSDQNAQIYAFPIAPLDCNASILICRKTGEAAVVDPGGDIPEMLELLDKNSAVLTWILHTHAHFDHCMSIDVIAEERKNTIQNIALHPEDFFWYENAEMMAGRFGFHLSPDRAVPEINHKLKDDEKLKVGEIEIQVIHTPGHSAGSVCFYLEKFSILIAGDTLFQGSIGRTDLEGGSFDAISSSIKNKLYTLPDSTIVITGHGPTTTIGMEKKSNAYVRIS